MTGLPINPPNLVDAAEMLWVTLASLDWSKQSAEWQEAAVRWRDYYFAAERERQRHIKAVDAAVDESVTPLPAPPAETK